MKGYTLIEIIIALSLLAIILLGGTTLFYQNLRSSGLSDVDLNLNSALRNILSAMEKDIRYSQVLSVGSGTRLDCNSAGVSGISGDTLEVRDLAGLETVYSLDNNRVASTASLTNVKVLISPADINISTLQFTWRCASGVSDKINIAIDASSSVLGSGINITRAVSSEVNLLNSGIN